MYNGHPQMNTHIRKRNISMVTRQRAEPVLHVILALIRVTYQFANNVKTLKLKKVNKSAYKHGLFFAFLSKAASKCRCFSIAHCFLWWWDNHWKIQSLGIGNVF